MNYLLLAEADSSPHWLEKLMQPEILVFAVPIIAIVGGIGYAITVAIIRHRERMEMLRHGIDPRGEDKEEKPA